MSEYKKRINKLKKFQIIIVLILVVAGLVYFYLVSRPKISVYNVPDSCMPIGGSISHSIGDEDACNNACNAYCYSLKKEKVKSEFLLRLGPQCNLCTCYCKPTINL